MYDEAGTISKFVNPFSQDVRRMSERFDYATINHNFNELEQLLAETEKMLCDENAASQAQLYYSMGTVYSDFAKFKGISTEKSTEKQLYYFRKSISLIEFNEYFDEKYKPYVLGFKRVLYTNYANTLDHCGRKIAAIEQYKKALNIDDNFGMALGNLGRVYQHYGMLEYDNGHRDIFHYFAYHYLDNAIKSTDPNTYSEAKDCFEATIDCYAPEYIEKVLKPDLCFKQFSYENPDELNYRKWCLSNGLFLNTLNDLPIAESCFAADVIQLPNMIANIHSKPIFHGMFSQLKQEYIYARYLYYSTLSFISEPHYADKDTYIKAYTDYSLYSIRVEKLKTAFKTLYGLFDKIAYFLEHYFELGINERDINFRSIWRDSAGKGKKAYNYKNVLNPSENFALSSLYWISKDFSEKFEDSPNPELKRISDIRNSLEHKYTKVYDIISKKDIPEYGDGLALYVSEEELYEVVIFLLKILREAIINLSLCVNIAEIPKREASKDKLVLQMSLMDYEDDWKI